MLRVTPDQHGPVLTLRVEGRLAEEWGPFLELHCYTVLQTTHRLQLDLANVTYVDAQGVGVLKKLKSRGVELVGCSHIIQDLMDESAA